MKIKIEMLDSNAMGSCSEGVGFGRVFSDHMFTQTYQEGSGWSDATIKPVQDFSLHPASAVFHYGQEIFEGLKAYKRSDGKINLFRADKNMKRFNLSAERMMMPSVDEKFHLEAIKKLIEVDQLWVPNDPRSSLYIRPAMIATTPVLGLAAASSYLHFVIAGPVGAYFDDTLNPISVFVSDVHRRAVKGGVGEAKTGGNYAASLFVSEKVKKEGFDQVLWLDAVNGEYIEEVGAMNIFFVLKGETIVTPALTGSILAGVTRDSLLELAPKLGYEVQEGRLELAEILDGIESGLVTEVFGCGTAAAISPVGRLSFKDKNFIINGGEVGLVAKHLYNELTSIQYGTKEDLFNWTSIV